MGAWVVRKMKIGYWPLSQSLSSPGDRRRLVFWAQSRGHQIITDLNQKVDVIVASEKSDFNSGYFARRKVPVIFDLIDGYLSPLNSRDDLARGFAKRLSGHISGGIKPFSKHVKDFCLAADGVICSSTEQEQLIKRYSSNTHVILDSHEELPFIAADRLRFTTGGNFQVLWEGQPATIRGVRQISSVLSKMNETYRLNYSFVTDQQYFQFLGSYLERSTLTLLKKDLGRIKDDINLIQWTLGNLVSTARQSAIAMIPIDLSVPIQRLKPENRLLIMWRLGLPCLTSPSPAYIRVAKKAGVNGICEDLEAWQSNFHRLLNSPSFAFEEIERGQNYLHENHTKAILLEKWDRAMESVLN
jgi:hypothetical protein